MMTISNPRFHRLVSHIIKWQVMNACSTYTMSTQIWWQTVSKMLTDFSGMPMVSIPLWESYWWFYGPWYSFQFLLNGFHTIRSMSHAFGWPYVGLVGKWSLLRIIVFPIWIFTIVGYIQSKLIPCMSDWFFSIMLFKNGTSWRCCHEAISWNFQFQW